MKRLLIGFSCHRPRITGWARIHPLVRPFVGRLMWAAVRATAAAAQEHAVPSAGARSGMTLIGVGDA